MPVRDPSTYDPDALTRDLNPDARAELRVEIPNYWSEDVHALDNLAHADILYPWNFDQLIDVNKHVVIARVEHLLGVLNERYIRKVAPQEIAGWQLLYHGGEPGEAPTRRVFYVRNEDVWRRILELATRPGAAGGTATDTAARELSDYLESASKHGDLIDASDLEKCFEHGRSYCETLQIARRRQPLLKLDDLDSDHVHAFLCAYEACFH